MTESLIEVIKKRRSVRTYKKENLDNKIIAKINSIISQQIRTPFCNKPEFVLLQKEFEESDKGLKLGTYGTIKGAKYFIVGFSELKDKFNEDFGYAFEKIILDLTDLGLGTCWIGGVASFPQISKFYNLAEKKVIPAISPVGYSAERMSVTEKVIRWTAGSAKRKPWNEIFFIDDLNNPIENIEDERFQTILEMVRLAPSASNKQPWRIIKEKEKNNFHFYLKRTPGYQKIRKNVDLQKMDIGIAMCHFELIANELGIKGEWCFSPPEINDEGIEYISSWITK